MRREQRGSAPARPRTPCRSAPGRARAAPTRGARRTSASPVACPRPPAASLLASMPLARISCSRSSSREAASIAARLGGRFGLQVVAAGPRRAAPPVLEVGVGTAAAGAHRGAIDRLLEALRQLHLGDLAAALDDDLRGHVAPRNHDQRRHRTAPARVRRSRRRARSRPSARRLVSSSPYPVSRSTYVETEAPRDARAPPAASSASRRLHEVHDSTVIAEVLVGEFRMTVDAEPLDDQSFEVTHQEIGQVERAGLLLRERRRTRGRSRRTRSSARRAAARRLLLGEHRVEQPAGAAVGIGDEDPFVTLARRRRSRRARRRVCARDGCAVPAAGTGRRRPSSR